MGLTLPVPMHKVSLMAASFIVELKPTKNAAVSSGRGKLSLFRLLGYWLAQLFGALLGVLAYWVISYETFEVHPADWFNSGQALAAELFFSFLLINGVVQTVVTDTLACNPFFGLAIGFCITAGAIAVGQVCCHDRWTKPSPKYRGEILKGEEKEEEEDEVVRFKLNKLNQVESEDKKGSASTRGKLGDRPLAIHGCCILQGEPLDDFVKKVQQAPSCS